MRRSLCPLKAFDPTGVKLNTIKDGNDDKAPISKGDGSEVYPKITSNLSPPELLLGLPKCPQMNGNKIASQFQCLFSPAQALAIGTAWGVEAQARIPSPESLPLTARLDTWSQFRVCIPTSCRKRTWTRESTRMAYFKVKGQEEFCSPL